MISKCIFVILAALYGLAIHFFIAEILPEFWRACIAYVKYIRLVRKIDFGTLLFVFVTISTGLAAYIIYIIGAELWMMNYII
jgi:hypothetical protein